MNRIEERPDWASGTAVPGGGGGLRHECELSRKNPQFRKIQFFEIRNWPQKCGVELAQKKCFCGQFRTADVVGGAGSKASFN